MSQGTTVVKKRPFGVTLLAILAGVAAVLAGIHALEAWDLSLCHRPG